MASERLDLIESHDLYFHVPQGDLDHSHNVAQGHCIAARVVLTSLSMIVTV